MLGPSVEYEGVIVGFISVTAVWVGLLLLLHLKTSKTGETAPTQAASFKQVIGSTYEVWYTTLRGSRLIFQSDDRLSAERYIDGVVDKSLFDLREMPVTSVSPNDPSGRNKNDQPTEMPARQAVSTSIR